ncbi:MAG: hypothetical protein ACLRWQ_01765 [Flavonifractor plautii]
MVKAMAPRLTARLDRTNRAARQPVLAQKPLGLAGSLAVHRSVRGPEKVWIPPRRQRRAGGT